MPMRSTEELFSHQVKFIYKKLLDNAVLFTKRNANITKQEFIRKTLQTTYL